MSISGKRGLYNVSSEGPLVSQCLYIQYANLIAVLIRFIHSTVQKKTTCFHIIIYRNMSGAVLGAFSSSPNADSSRVSVVET